MGEWAQKSHKYFSILVIAPCALSCIYHLYDVSSEYLTFATVITFNMSTSFEDRFILPAMTMCSCAYFDDEIFMDMLDQRRKWLIAYGWYGGDPDMGPFCEAIDEDPQVVFICNERYVERVRVPPCIFMKKFSTSHNLSTS